ncbi:Ribosomal protein S18 acetylase RimI [Lentzea xinjiangensis]|uniref:Ribosomal protein S18 acetylase RimI n=1 Tax=Lentzea xinjiangensis TaxID=402600 RepID=A0A1H9PY49_9PSEU|nr:GNAT family N-acetyltransferase [Lentzea xinjiangensis]SER52523.1 Ribosomal protein S18 acetylase RimI [Lentzea xinjiangensis]
MADVTVRPALESDLASIGAITVEAYRVDGFVDEHDDYATTLADAASRFREAEVLVAVDSASGEVLGSVAVVRPGTPYAEISRPGEVEFRMLSVATAARGRGVGEALVRAVIGKARGAGASAVVLSSSEKMQAAHRLYRRLGFTRLPDRDWLPVPGADLVAQAYRLPL